MLASRLPTETEETLITLPRVSRSRAKKCSFFLPRNLPSTWATTSSGVLTTGFLPSGRLRKRLAEVYTQYLDASQSVEDFHSGSLPMARRAYELQVASYHQRRTPWAQVIASRRIYFELSEDYVESLLALRRATPTLTADEANRETLRRAVLHGTVCASFAVERFSLERFHSLRELLAQQEQLLPRPRSIPAQTRGGEIIVGPYF